MSTIGLLWGLCGDQLCMCRPINQSGATNPAVFTWWTSPACLSSATHLLPDTALNICSGWTHTVLTTHEGLAYVADTSQLVQALHGPLKRPLSQAIRSPAGQHQQHQHQQQDQQPTQYSNNTWQLVTCTPPTGPVQLTVPVLQVAAGDLHCLLLDSNGSVWAFGSNKNGQLGISDKHFLLASKIVAESSTSSSVALGDPAQLQDAAQEKMPQVAAELPEQQQQQQQRQQQQQQQQQWGMAHSPQNCPVLVLGPGSAAHCQEHVAQVAAGACHSLAVTAETGRLYCWGWSAHGQCGTGSTNDVLQPTLCSALDGVPLAAAAAGMAHTVVLSKDGAVYTSGWNSNGQLGLGARQGSRVQGQQEQQQQSSLVPVLVQSDVMDSEHIIQVACGSRHSVALAASGRVFSWGFNKYSQCCTVVLPHSRETTESLQYAGNEASSSSSGVRNRPQPQDDVPAPHMVLLPESVWLAEQVVSQSGQPVGPNAVGVHHTKQHTADAEEDEDCKLLQIMQAVGVQAGGWHTLIEVQVRQVMQQ